MDGVQLASRLELLRGGSLLFTTKFPEITANANVHSPKPVPTDIIIKSDLVLINPIGEDRVRGWSM